VSVSFWTVTLVADLITVSIRVAAEMLDMAPSVLRTHIDRGEIPVVKFPSTKRHGEQSRRVQILVDDLKAFAVRYRVEATR
jgi:hypothetical protein